MNVNDWPYGPGEARGQTPPYVGAPAGTPAPTIGPRIRMFVTPDGALYLALADIALVRFDLGEAEIPGEGGAPSRTGSAAMRARVVMKSGADEYLDGIDAEKLRALLDPLATEIDEPTPVQRRWYDSLYAAWKTRTDPDRAF